MVKEIDNSYQKIALTNHPDKGELANQEIFVAAAAAVKTLRQWIHELQDDKKVSFSTRELEGRLHENGLQLEEITGDGNCFYNTMLDQIYY